MPPAGSARRPSLLRAPTRRDRRRQFVNYHEDSGGVTYLPPTGVDGSGGAQQQRELQRDLVELRKQLARESVSSAAAAGGGDHSVRSAEREADYWVPADAYTIANDFRHAHVPQLPMELFAELLLRLNRVWKAREGRSLERQRLRLTAKVEELRRRLSQSMPYEDVLNSSEVERLKRELRSLRATFNSGRRRLNETEERLLESSLSSAGELTKQQRRRAHECEQLRAALAEEQIAAKSAFSDGASAVANEAAAEGDLLVERVHELMRQYQQTTMELSQQHGHGLLNSLRAQSSFLETLAGRLAVCRERIADIYEKAMSKSAIPRSDSDQSLQPPGTDLE